MKTIVLEHVDPQITEALKHQRREDPILLTQGSDALSLSLGCRKVPRTGMWMGLFGWLSIGRVIVIIEAKHSQHFQSEVGAVQPVFGGCKGMMTIVSEDDEHLKDFEEYMK